MIFDKDELDKPLEQGEWREFGWVKQNWLRNQLVESKKKHPMWFGFADTLSLLFAKHVDYKWLQRISGLNSYFTMDDESLQKKIDELGWFFILGEGIETEDRALSTLQKMDEIHFKSTDVPLLNIIAREFKGLKAEWKPVYCRKGVGATPEAKMQDLKNKYADPNRSYYETDRYFKDYPHEKDNYFLTSRGYVSVELTDLSRLGITNVEFEDLVKRLIEPLLPIEIVIEGTKMDIFYRFIEGRETFEVLELPDKPVIKLPEDLIHEEKDAFVTGMISGSENFVLDNDSIYKGPYIVTFDDGPLDTWLLDSGPI